VLGCAVRKLFPFLWKEIYTQTVCTNISSYIVHMQETEFLLHGGDIRWLESDENVPPKLLVIRELNAILAHQPWLLKSEHLQRLAHPASSLGGQVSWSLSECVLAILVCCLSCVFLLVS